MAGQAFRLKVAARGLATLTFDLAGSRVNLFDRETLEDLARQVESLSTRRDVDCLILLSAKSASFCHGVRVDLIAGVTDPAEAEAAARFGQEVFAAWESLPFPTLAAIDGTCMGGGTELSLASTWRVVSHREDLRIGLPEVRIGILPGWGGCVRLPRRVGLTAALELILTGKGVPPDRALKMGLVDAVLPAPGFLHHVRDFALDRLSRPGGEDGEPHGESHLRELLQEKNPLGRKIVFDQARKKTLRKADDHYPAPLRAIEVVRVGIEQGRRAGFAAEARAVGELATGTACKNLIHVFLLHQAARRSDGSTPGDTPTEQPPIRRTAVVGAGLMGSAIAQLIADKAGLPVRLQDVDPAALGRSLAGLESQIANRLSRRRLTSAEAQRLTARIQPAAEYRGFRRVDLVVEAVPEELATKKRVLAEVAAVVGDEAVLASNTSSLSIDQLAADLPHPERLLGLHFFNPAQRMPLVEVVAGRRTDERTLEIGRRFVRSLDKIPIPVRDSPGFLVNRLLNFYLSEALWLLEEGYGVEDLDRVLTEWGMPQGPFALIDQIGIDVAVEVSAILVAAFGERLAFPDRDWQAAFLDRGLLGVKRGAGFYRYEKGRPTDFDAEVYHRLGLSRRRSGADSQRIVDRMILPMVNEAARCLEEGVVPSAADVDLAVILGLGFPPFRGGLCRWADQQGLEEVVRVLDNLASQGHERLRPGKALIAAADRGGLYAAFPR